MIFKTIPRELKDEGITLDLLNNINLKVGYSPIIAEKGDEPAKLLQCAKGFWVSDDEGGYLKLKNGSLLVLEERTVQIGRARFLLQFGHEEKKVLVDEQEFKWKKAIRDVISGVSNGDMLSKKQVDKLYAAVEQTYHHADHYSILKVLFKKEKFTLLMSILDIKPTFLPGINLRDYAAAEVTLNYPWLEQFTY